MKLRTVVATMLCLLGLVTSASAARLVQGKSVVWAGLHGNRAQLMEPDFNKRSSVYESGELGLHLAYSYFLTDQWAAVVSGGIDAGSLQLKPAAGATQKQTSNSWNTRFGFDRYAFINDDVAVYAGPGFLYWRGRGEGDGLAPTSLNQKWPIVRGLAFNGRLGLHARFGSHYGLFGHIGQVIGSNSTSSGGTKVTWWTSHHEGTVGLAVDL